MEDLEYVERVTGTSLEQYKEQVMKQQAKRAKSKSKSGATATPSSTNETKYASSATAAIMTLLHLNPQDHKQQHKYPIMVPHCMTGLTFSLNVESTLVIVNVTLSILSVNKWMKIFWKTFHHPC